MGHRVILDTLTLDPGSFARVGGGGRASLGAFSACAQRKSLNHRIIQVTNAGVPAPAATMSGTDANSDRRRASFDLARSSPRETNRKSPSATFDLGSGKNLSISRHFSESAGRSPRPPASSSPSGSGSPRVRPMTWGQTSPSNASPRSAGSPASATRGSSRNLVESLRAEVSQAEEMEKLRRNSGELSPGFFRRAQGSPGSLKSCSSFSLPQNGNVSPLLRASFSGAMPASMKSSMSPHSRSPNSPSMSPRLQSPRTPLVVSRSSAPSIGGSESGMSWTSKDKPQSSVHGGKQRRPQKASSFDSKAASFDLGSLSATSPDASPVLRSRKGPKGGLPWQMAGLSLAAGSGSGSLSSSASTTTSPKPPPGSGPSSPKPPGPKHPSPSPSPRSNSIKVVPAAQQAVHARPPARAGAGERRRASVLLGATREAAPWIVDDALLAKFEGEEEIGSGKFASVRRKLVNGKYVAIKGLKRKEVYDERGVDEEEARKTLVHESELVSCLDHPNIIRVTSLVKSSDGSKVFMIQDECEGTIRQVYAMEEKKWRRASTSLANQSSIYGNYTESRWLPPPTTALKLCKELVAAVEYLQCDLKHPMLHRDMCPENCLISKEGILKLSDFGSARIVTNDEKVEGGEVWGGKQGYLLTGGLGSVRYAAPETLGERCLDRSTSESPEPKKNNRAPLLVKQSSNESEGGYMNAHLLLHYDEKSEMHSMAMMLYYIATSDHPFKHMNASDAADHIRAGGRPDLNEKSVSRMNDYSSFFTYTLEHLWAHEPEDRCSAADAASFLSASTSKGKSPKTGDHSPIASAVAAKMGFASAL